jgi:hypothetical protein
VKKGRTSYQLGALIGDRQYHYTAMKAQRTLAGALAQRSAMPNQSSVDVVYRQREAVSCGIVYGFEVDILSPIDGAVLIPWR